MAVERITPQLVKKGKGKKRPGYRGPGGYQGGRGGSKASSGGSRGTSNTGGAGNQNTGNARDDYRANYSSRSIVKGGGTKKAGGGYNDAKVSGDRGRSSAREFVQQLNNDNAIRAAQTGTRFTPYKGGSRPKGGMSGLGSLIMSGLGMLMGIPGLGLLTGGLGKLKGGLGSLNDKIQSTDFARSTSLMDYLDAKKYGGIDARDRAASKNMREARGIQTAMDMRPTTLDPREMARMGLQMPTAPMSKPTFSDPFANTVGTTTKVNAPSNDAVSSVTPETGFFENQFNKFFSGPEFDAYNAVRTDKYANAPSKFDYDFNTNKAAMQMINDKITNNAKGTIFGGLPSELASVVGNIAAVPGSIPASLAHEFVQSRERVQDQFKGASPSIMAEGPSIGDYYSGFMNENPFATAGTRALGIGAALPDALGKVYNSLGFADGGVASMFTRRG